MDYTKELFRDASQIVHKTEVEPDSFSNGSTIVMAFQAGRFTTSDSSNIGWATSTNGGATWSAPAQLAGPMNEAWLASTSEGNMVGDYFSASFANGKCFPVFSVAAQPPSSGVFSQAIYTWSSGLTISGGTCSGAGSHVYGAPSRPAVTGKRRTVR